MKKLMFKLACVAGLSAAHAGAVAWSVYDADYTGANDIAFYLFEGDLTTGSTIASITDAASASTYVASAVASSVLPVSDSYYMEGSITGLEKGARTYYAVVFDNSTIADSDAYKVFGSYTANVPANGSFPLEIDLAGGVNPSSAGWQSLGGGGGGGGDVPEPTSGLLLVLGGAMLALRRRRA